MNAISALTTPTLQINCNVTQNAPWKCFSPVVAR